MSLVIYYSPEAAADLAGTHTQTTYQWGIQQAEDYITFLQKAVEDLASGFGKGIPIEGRKGILGKVVKWPGAKNGHRIIYVPIDNGVYVLRVLHTAMDPPRHL